MISLQKHKIFEKYLPPHLTILQYVITIGSKIWSEYLYYVEKFHRCAVACFHFTPVQRFASLWIVAHQAPLSMGFSRQEYWSGLPPAQGDLPNSGVEPTSLALQVDFYPLRHLRSPGNFILLSKCGSALNICPLYFWCCEIFTRVILMWNYLVLSLSLGLKSLLMKMKEESEKASLKLNIQNMNIMASDSITSWQIDGETMETMRDFIFEGSKNHCRWWLQPWN